MFRRLPSSVPPDYCPPTTLEQLGFFVNEDDQVRLIHKPEQKYQYKINRNDRVNDVVKEAVNGCIRDAIKSRLAALDLEILRLPLGAQNNEQHVPIYVSKGIDQKKRVLVLFGERNQELGILSYRSIRENGIKNGSAQAMIDAITNNPTQVSSDDVPGIIIANPGQLIWYRAGGRAITYHEYMGVRRQSAVHEPFRIDSIKNRVPGNVTFTDHVQYAFENVMVGIAHPEAKFDIIGLEYTGDAVVHYLADHWDVWQHRVNGLCLGNPQFKLKDIQVDCNDENNFHKFLAQRARAYFVSEHLVETPIAGRDECGCNCYSSGEQYYEDGILVKSWRSMLDWFNMISTIHDYQEPNFKTIDGKDIAAVDE